MKTRVKDFEQHELRVNKKLFRRLFELQIELESQVELGHDSEELKAIIDAIDRLFESKTN